MFIFSFTIDQEEANAPTTNYTNETVAINETIDPPPVEDLTEQEKSDAQSRDQQRLDDINTLTIALDDYVNNNGYYPDTIDEIVPDYISELPIDPMPEIYEYSYTCIGSTGPCVYYDLSYTLEIGTDDLPAGMNLESPDEIATP